MVRFGISTDAHLMGRTAPASHVDYLGGFVQAMASWEPDFVIDLGDFACQAGDGPTTSRLHDAQLAGLKNAWARYRSAGRPAYSVLGNHDVGWVRGGDETLSPEALFGSAHAGEDITKAEHRAATGMPGRYYSFDIRGWHFIVLDGNNPAGELGVVRGRDRVEGAYWIDRAQRDWLAGDLAGHRSTATIVFCHQELHHTPPEGSSEGGDVPFPPVGKETSFVDNGWQVREIFARHSGICACFSGHKHDNRWTVRDGTHYVTLAALHWGGSYARVSLAGEICIEGAGNQRSLTLPIRASPSER